MNHIEFPVSVSQYKLPLPTSTHVHYSLPPHSNWLWIFDGTVKGKGKWHKKITIIMTVTDVLTLIEYLLCSKHYARLYTEINSFFSSWVGTDIMLFSIWGMWDTKKLNKLLRLTQLEFKPSLLGLSLCPHILPLLREGGVRPRGAMYPTKIPGRTNNLALHVWKTRDGSRKIGRQVTVGLSHNNAHIVFLVYEKTDLALSKISSLAELLKHFIRY